MPWTVISKNHNYEVTPSGDVRNRRTGRVLVGGINNSGYRTVHLKKSETEFVHRLVAETFIPNEDPEHKKDVNHIDGNKLNNNVENLEWVSRSDNVRHAYANGLNRPSGGGHNKRAIRVIETGEIYPSQEECARAIGGSIAGVSMAVNGVRNKHKGYHFEYV